MAGERRPSLAAEIEQWLATVSVNDTLTSSLDDTIVPDIPATDEPARTDSGKRAIAVLHELAGLSPTSTAQLRQGDVIAEGGMGVIRSGFQVSLGRTVAVKTLRHDRQSPGDAIDLMREAWITGVVEHPNVVPVHYVGIDDAGQPVIVLKRIEGVEWSALVANPGAVHERFGTTDLLAWNLGILMQLLNALQFAHARGIVHRDLKPSNVMIGAFGEVYLLDWGIAVSLREDELGRLPLASRATAMAGTPSYMAPEMLGRAGSAPISERTDVYLAGSVLYEIMAGHPPHQGRTVIEVMTSVLHSQPALPPSAPGELVRICTRAMQASPDDRFASVEELRLALVSFLEHRGSARLLDVANERLARLLELLARPSEADESEIYRLFGACRFGFHEALAAWRDNEDALRGLVRATSAVAEHVLATGEPSAAVALLSELADPPTELMARARRAVADQAERRGEAEHLRREHDVVVGTRTRTFLMAILGVMFTALPLSTAIDAGFPFVRGYTAHALWSLLLFLVVGGFAIWARESTMASVLNRRAFVAVQALFLCQVLLCAAAWRLGISVEATEILMVFLWVVISGMASLAIDRRLLAGSVVYLIAFVIILRFPAQRFYIMSAGNFLFAVNAVWHWRPSRQRPTRGSAA